MISKALVAKAAASCKELALEDLTGIRERVNVRHEQRAEHHSWSFYQLRLFLTYKAAAAGVPVVLVDPAFTSQACSACGHCERANRRSQDVFLCRSCGLTLNADWNGALNIAYRAAVTSPWSRTLCLSSRGCGKPMVQSGARDKPTSFKAG